MHVERVKSNDLVVNGLPDGSRAIVNSNNETVFAMNATAGAAWDACSEPTTLSKMTEDMRRSFDPHVTEEIAEQAILRLQEKNLVKMSGETVKTTRREVLAGLSAVALPIVVALTMGEQKAHAQKASSVENDSRRRPHTNVEKHHENKS